MHANTPLGFSAPNTQNPVIEPPHIELHQEAPLVKKFTHFTHHLFHYWHKIAIILLTIHGLAEIFESLYFITVEYSHLSELLELHQIEEAEINQLISKLIIPAGTSLLHLFFVVRLSKVTETTAHNIDLIVATILIFTTQFIQKLLIEINFINLILHWIS